LSIMVTGLPPPTPSGFRDRAGIGMLRGSCWVDAGARRADSWRGAAGSLLRRAGHPVFPDAQPW
jgi:hypothetical protein